MRPSSEIATGSVNINPAPPDAALYNCCSYALAGIPCWAAQEESGDETTRLGRCTLRNLRGVNKGGGATIDTWLCSGRKSSAALSVALTCWVFQRSTKSPKRGS